MLGESDRIAAIRKLVAPLTISGELERLEAVFALCNAGPPDDALSMTFLSEMQKMRNPDNYPRALEMVEQAHPALQWWALKAIGSIGDLRAVPLLIRLLDSDDQRVR
jgi:HEAT repeat protein